MGKRQRAGGGRGEARVAMTAMAVAGAAAGDGCFKKITSKEYIHLEPQHLGDVKAVGGPSLF